MQTLVSHRVIDQPLGPHPCVFRVPAKVLVDLCPPLQVTWVPVVGQFVLCGQVLENCRAAVWRESSIE